MRNNKKVFIISLGVVLPLGSIIGLTIIKIQDNNKIKSANIEQKQIYKMLETEKVSKIKITSDHQEKEKQNINNINLLINELEKLTVKEIGNQLKNKETIRILNRNLLLNSDNHEEYKIVEKARQKKEFKEFNKIKAKLKNTSKELLIAQNLLYVSPPKENVNENLKKELDKFVGLWFAAKEKVSELKESNIKYINLLINELEKLTKNNLADKKLKNNNMKNT